jgi:hypothetical protein
MLYEHMENKQVLYVVPVSISGRLPLVPVGDRVVCSVLLPGILVLAVSHAVTAAGSRLVTCTHARTHTVLTRTRRRLQAWLLRPLVDVDAIEVR